MMPIVCGSAHVLSVGMSRVRLSSDITSPSTREGHVVVGDALGLSVLEVDIGMNPIQHPAGFIFGGTRFEAPGGDMNALARDVGWETCASCGSAMDGSTACPSFRGRCWPISIARISGSAAMKRQFEESPMRFFGEGTGS
jgi:hypothetical protein